MWSLPRMENLIGLVVRKNLKVRQNTWLTYYNNYIDQAKINEHDDFKSIQEKFNRFRFSNKLNNFGSKVTKTHSVHAYVIAKSSNHWTFT